MKHDLTILDAVADPNLLGTSVRRRLLDELARGARAFLGFLMTAVRSGCRSMTKSRVRTSPRPRDDQSEGSDGGQRPSYGATLLDANRPVGFALDGTAIFVRGVRPSGGLRLRPVGVPPTSDITVVSTGALSVLTARLPMFSLAIVDPTAAGGRRDGCAVVDTWLSGASSVMTPDHHVFIVCPSGEEADLELVLRSHHVPIQSRIVWHHPDFTVERSPIGFLSTHRLILHGGTHPLRLTADRARRAPFSDVQSFPTRDAEGDSVPKPVELVRWLVSTGSTPGDHVLDVFGGDATTASACQALGRHCTVIERNPAMAEETRRQLRFEPHQPRSST